MSINPDQIKDKALELIGDKSNLTDEEYIGHLENTIVNLLEIIEQHQNENTPHNETTTENLTQKHLFHNFSTFFNTTDTLIAILDDNRVFSDANPAFIKELGYSKDELKNLTITDIVHISEKKLFDNITSLTDSIINQNNLIPFNSKNNQQIWLNCSTIPFINENSLIFFGQIKNSDFLKDEKERNMDKAEPMNIEALNNELKKANIRMHSINAELHKAKAKAEESDRLKSSFLANMSHEIRTPMNGIIGFANLLASDNLSIEKKQHYINIINSSAGLLLTIISDIIDISKIEAGQLDIVLNSFEVNEIIEELRVQFENEIKSKNKSEISLTTDISKQSPIVVSDAARIKQVISNLLNNAIKFTDKGFIKFGYQINDHNIVFYVEDSGKGISNDNLEIIFERFRQEELTNTREFGGTGLGLSISKALTEQMGGQLKVDSTKGKGTLFYFNIPIQSKPPLKTETRETTDETDKINWSGKSILVVEDMDITRILINEILEPTNAKIILTDLGTEAISICKNNLPDLILMDIQLPDINGYEATKEIKGFAPDLPVIAQTAYAMSSDEKLARSFGCNDYIAKPYNRKKLLLLMNKYLK